MNYDQFILSIVVFAIFIVERWRIRILAFTTALVLLNRGMWWVIHRLGRRKRTRWSIRVYAFAVKLRHRVSRTLRKVGGEERWRGEYARGVDRYYSPRVARNLRSLFPQMWEQ